MATLIILTLLLLLILILLLALLSAFFFHITRFDPVRPEKNKGQKPKLGDILDGKFSSPKKQDVPSVPKKITKPDSATEQPVISDPACESSEALMQRLQAMAEESKTLEVPQDLAQAARAEEEEMSAGSDARDVVLEPESPRCSYADRVVGEKAEGVALRTEQANARVLELSEDDMNILQMSPYTASRRSKVRKDSLEVEVSASKGQEASRTSVVITDDAGPVDWTAEIKNRMDAKERPEQDVIRPDKGAQVIGTEMTTVRMVDPLLTGEGLSVSKDGNTTYTTPDGYLMVEAPPLPFKGKSHLDNFINYLLRTDPKQKHTTRSTPQCHVAFMNDLDRVYQLSSYDMRIRKRTELKKLIHKYVQGDEVRGLYMQLIEMMPEDGKEVVLTPFQCLEYFKDYIRRHEATKGERKVLVYVEHTEPELHRVYHIHTIFYQSPQAEGMVGQSDSQSCGSHGFSELANRKLKEMSEGA